MSGISNYAKDLIADTIVNRSSLPATVYIGLVLAEPNASSNGSTITEPPSGVGYGRKSFTLGSSHWGAASNGISRNSVSVEFTSSAYAPWGRAIGWVMCTASSAGEVLFWGTFDESKDISTGSTVSIPVEAMQISVIGP